MSYFWNPAGTVIGVKANVERHRQKEAELAMAIEALERIETPTDMDLAAIRTYRHFLYLLQNSKAEAVAKIGSKNES